MIKSKDAKIGDLYFAIPYLYSDNVFLIKLLKTSQTTYPLGLPLVKILLRLNKKEIFNHDEYVIDWVWNTIFKLKNPKFKEEYDMIFNHPDVVFRAIFNSKS